MAALAAQTVTNAGVVPTYNACAGGGDTVPCGDRVFLHFKNASGAPITVTIDDPNSSSPEGATAFNPDSANVVGAGAERVIGPIHADRFANATDGLAHLTYSGVTTFTVAVLQLESA